MENVEVGVRIYALPSICVFGAEGVLVASVYRGYVTVSLNQTAKDGRSVEPSTVESGQ